MEVKSTVVLMACKIISTLLSLYFWAAYTPSILGALLSKLLMILIIKHLVGKSCHCQIMVQK